MDSLCSHARVQCTRSGVNYTYGAGPAAASVFVLSLFGSAGLHWHNTVVADFTIPCALIGSRAFGY